MSNYAQTHLMFHPTLRAIQLLFLVRFVQNTFQAGFAECMAARQQFRLLEGFQTNCTLEIMVDLRHCQLYRTTVVLLRSVYIVSSHTAGWHHGQYTTCWHGPALARDAMDDRPAGAGTAYREPLFLLRVINFGLTMDGSGQN